MYAVTEQNKADSRGKRRRERRHDLPRTDDESNSDERKPGHNSSGGPPLPRADLHGVLHTRTVRVRALIVNVLAVAHGGIGGLALVR